MDDLGDYNSSHCTSYRPAKNENVMVHEIKSILYVCLRKEMGVGEGVGELSR